MFQIGSCQPNLDTLTYVLNRIGEYDFCVVVSLETHDWVSESMYKVNREREGERERKEWGEGDGVGRGITYM